MNEICQSTLPIAPALPSAGALGAVDPDSSERVANFALLLQQLCSETADAGQTDHFPIPADEIAELPTDVEARDVADPAENLGMFAWPNVPIATPAPIRAIDAALEDTTLERRPPVSTDAEATIATPTVAADDEASIPADLRKTQWVAPDPLVSQPLPKASDEPLLKPIAPPVKLQLDLDAAAPRETKPTLEVANVLGIIPPVQTPQITRVESVIRDTRQPNAKRVATAPISSAPPVHGSTTVSNEPAITAGTTATAPAISTAQIAQPARAESRNIPTAAQPVDSAPAVTNATALPTPEKTNGTTAAKPGFEMSATTFQRPQRPAEADPAALAPREIASLPISSKGMQTPRTAPIQTTQNAREQFAGDRPSGEEPLASPTPDISFASVPAQSVRATLAEPTAAPIRAADVERVVTHTLHAAESLRTSGQDRVEVTLKLDNGSGLTIQLRLENGGIMPVFRTESEALRVALEQNWAQFTQRGGDHELRITNPVFESPQTSSNMSDLNQQRDGRQRAFQEQGGTFPQHYWPRRNSRANAPRPATPGRAPQPGVRLYA